MTKPAVFIASSVEGIGTARELGRQLESVAEVTFWSDDVFQPWMCSGCGWSDWRSNRMGKDEFPTVPLAFIDGEEDIQQAATKD